MATITGNTGLTFVLDKSVSYITQIALDLGYYQNDISGEQLINNAIDVTSLAATTGWTQFLAGKLHNLVTSYVRFPLGGFFDRSNTTIWNATARTDDYDAANVSDFRIDKLDYDTLNSMLNTDYQDTFFEAFKASYSEKNYISEIFTYATKKTGADLTKVLNYINYDL